jgi:serine-type D-Ala-D-Ala carboxypeptidase/endopeptidase
MPRFHATLITLVALPFAGAAQHFPSDEDLRLMARYLVEDAEAPAVVLGVVDPDGSARVVAFGAAAAGPGRPGDAPYLFDIGTLTMTFTASLLAEMAARGEVGLDDPVRSYLPAQVALPSPGGYEITLGDLATHRSGLPVGPRDPDPDMSLADLYAMVASIELDRPGRRYELSYLGYALLGQALARAAGTDFETLLRQRVLEPLGMASTGFASGPADGSLVAGHARGREVPAAVVPGLMRPATGLRSSGEDMIRFLAANVAPPETELGRAMRAAHEIRVKRGRHDEEIGYGFSWRTQSVAGQPPIVNHGGRARGFVSMIAFDPDRRVGTVVLTSEETFNDRIGRSLLFFDPPPWPEVQVDPDRLRRWHGTYRSNVGMYRANLRQGRHFIRLEEDGHLTYQPNGRARVRLYARSDSVFSMLRIPATLTFSTDGDAVAMRFEVDERQDGGRGWTAWKVRDRTPPPAVVAGNAGFWRAWPASTWLFLGLALAAAAVAMTAWARSAVMRRRGMAGRPRSASPS